MITLGADPWSERVITALRDSPHQATLQLWAGGKPPTEYDTPYFQHLMTRKKAPAYKAQLMQDAFHELKSARGWNEPVRFRIANDGGINCDDGWHRLNILLHRGEPLTGRVTGRETEWQRLRDGIAARIKSSGWGGALYHPIPHPDLQVFPVHHAAPLPLAEFVREHRIRSAVDLGARFGWALYGLRNELSEGTGIELEHTAYHILKLVLDSIGMTAVKGDVREYLARGERADVTLALNVLHHVPLDLTLDAIRSEFVAVSLPNDSEEGSKRLPPDAYEYVRERLNASLMFEGGYAGRRLQVLRRRS